MKNRENVERERALFEKKHLSGAGGFEISRLWSRFVDQFIDNLLDESIEGKNLSGFALVALGGYGRGELNPHSDIDLLFLFEKTVPLQKAGPTTIIPKLWDCGFKVGHSTRSIGDCVKIAAEDSISKTSMIEARFLSGDREIFNTFERIFRKKSVSNSPLAFIKNKVLEAELRHEEFGKTPLLTEPNIKESPGGLRDYQTALWVAAARYDVKDIESLEKRGLLSKKEMDQAVKALDLLYKIRNDLHFQENGPVDTLSYSLQPSVARRLGYEGEDELIVPLMMNDYYRAADSVYRFSKSITAQAIRYRSKAGMLFLKLRHKQIAPNIFAGPEEIYTKDITPKDIASEPEKFFLILTLMAEEGLKPSPALTKALEDVGAIWKKQKPEMKKLAKGFRELIKLDEPAYLLRLMRDSKILTSIIPEFHAVRYLTPFDLYHKFTVDDHTFLAIKEFDNLKRNNNAECDLLRQLYEREKRKDLLRLAILLHDVGKGGENDGPEEDIPPEAIKRLGYSDEDTVMVRRLVQLHLLMNMVAQRRDIHDKKTIADFCKNVGDAKTLKKLYLLTFADTSAVAPGVWNSWKGSLLKELFVKALTAFEGTKEKPRRELSRKAAMFAQKMPAHYLPLREAEQVEKDAKLFEQFSQNDASPLLYYRDVAENEPGELTLMAKDETGLLSKVVGALMAKNVNTHHAKIFTRSDGIVVDFLRLTGRNDTPIADMELWTRTKAKVEKVLKGEISVEDLIKSRERKFHGMKSLPKIAPQVKTLNGESFDHTVIEVEARDRLGLLYDITRAIASLGIGIMSAQITTEGQKALNSFYINEQRGGKVKGSARMTEIKKTIQEVIG